MWRFLAEFQLPYCSLYDEGYTSLGNIDNTEKNPALRTKAGYLPASALTDWNLERAGRVKRVDSDTVLKMAQQAVRDTCTRLQQAKTVSIIYLHDTPNVKILCVSIFCLLSLYLYQRSHLEGLESRGLSVKYATTCSQSELQEEVRRQSDLCDFVLVEKGNGVSVDLLSESPPPSLVLC